MSKAVRKNISIPSEKQIKEYKKFRHDAGYPGFSQMVNTLINNAMKNFYKKNNDESEKVVDQIRNIGAVTNHKLDLINSRVELVEMRINKQGINPKILKVINEIRQLIIKRGELDRFEIHAHLKKYDSETIDTAIVWARDGLEDIGYYTKKSK